MDAKSAHRGSQYPVLAQALGGHLVLRSGHGGRYAITHDKFAVVDGTTVVTGSSNWTYAA
jgi:phosphatidylserine/phosphatidylglycerophosphate/cardiolipin synthase-like enzyme